MPASTQLRQLAMWYHLRALPELADIFCGGTLRDDVVDLKESLRLRSAQSPVLSIRDDFVSVSCLLSSLQHGLVVISRIWDV